MSRAAKVYSAVVWGLGVLSGAILVAIATATAAEVIVRAAWQIAFPWLTELAEYGLFIATFAGCPLVLKEGGHVRFELLMGSTTIGRLFYFCSLVLGFCVCIFLVIYGVVASLNAYTTSVINFNYFVVQDWWLLIWIPIAGALMAVEFLLNVVRFVTGKT